MNSTDKLLSKSKLIDSELAELVGKDALDYALAHPCRDAEFTTGLDVRGFYEFTSHLGQLKTLDGKHTLDVTAYYYQYCEDVERVEDLSDLNWLCYKFTFEIIED